MILAESPGDSLLVSIVGGAVNRSFRSLPAAFGPLDKNFPAPPTTLPIAVFEKTFGTMFPMASPAA